MHAVEGGDYRELSVADLVAAVKKLAGPPQAQGGLRQGIEYVCWTGGEPLLQWRSMADAIFKLSGNFCHTIETDGEVDFRPFNDAVRGHRDAGQVRYIVDVKCPGSGMTAKKVFDNLAFLEHFDEVKFVLLDGQDYEFAKETLAKYPALGGKTVLFSPVTAAHKVQRGLDPATLAQWILDDKLSVRLQLQIHKVVWPGKERGI